MQISEERKKRIIDLYFNQHKTWAEIAQIERISLRDIHAIIKEEKAKRQKYKGQQQQKELSSKVYELFSEKKTTVEVAITLNLREPEVSKIHRGYWKLKRLYILNSICKDNSNNITKYLEFNKDTVLDLTEKNYENLVEALTNNAVNSAAASSLSNPTLSLPHPSTFPNLSNQTDIYRLEEPESFHNSQGDIAD